MFIKINRKEQDAILKCKKYIKGKYFLVLLPDDLIIKNCTKEMIKLHNKMNCSVIATKSVKKKTFLDGEFYP